MGDDPLGLLDTLALRHLVRKPSEGPCFFFWCCHALVGIRLAAHGKVVHHVAVGSLLLGCIPLRASLAFARSLSETIGASNFSEAFDHLFLGAMATLKPRLNARPCVKMATEMIIIIIKPTTTTSTTTH